MSLCPFSVYLSLFLFYVCPSVSVRTSLFLCMSSGLFLSHCVYTLVSSLSVLKSLCLFLPVSVCLSVSLYRAPASAGLTTLSLELVTNTNPSQLQTPSANDSSILVSPRLNRIVMSSHFLKGWLFSATVSLFPDAVNLSCPRKSVCFATKTKKKIHSYNWRKPTYCVTMVHRYHTSLVIFT